MAITLRNTKGSALTYAEADANISELDNRTKLAWAQSGSELEVVPGDDNAPTFQSFRGPLYAWSYAANQFTEAHLNFDVEYSHAPGTDLYAGIHWSPGNSSLTGNIRFGLEFSWAWAFGATQSTNTTFSEPTTVYINAASDGTPYKHYVTFNNESDKFPGFLVQGNMRFLARVFRDGEHPSDTFNDPVFVLGVDLFYQIDRFGTSTKEPPFVY